MLAIKYKLEKDATITINCESFTPFKDVAILYVYFGTMSKLDVLKLCSRYGFDFYQNDYLELYEITIKTDYITTITNI